MKALSRTECEAWFHARSIKVEANLQPALPEDLVNVLKEIPQPASEVMALSLGLTQALHGQKGLLLLSDWHDIMVESAYEDYRRFFAVDSLKDHPGQEFDLARREEGNLLCLLIVFILSCDWQAFIYLDDGVTLVWLADGVIQLISSDTARAESLVEALERLG